MDRTIQAFRKQNAAVIKILERVRSLGFTTIEAQTLFMDSKEKLLAHFAEEERVLHPMVIEAAKDDYYLSKTVAFFLSEIDRSSETIDNFFCKYRNGGTGLEYAEEFGVLFAALLQRTRLEEHAICNIYEEIQDAKPGHVRRSA